MSFFVVLHTLVRYMHTHSITKLNEQEKKKKTEERIIRHFNDDYLSGCKVNHETKQKNTVSCSSWKLRSINGK